MIECISAVTLATHDMARALRFYEALGFELIHGGDKAAFSSLRAGTSYLNFAVRSGGRQWGWWGRVIVYVADLDVYGSGVVAREQGNFDQHCGEHAALSTKSLPRGGSDES